MTGDGAATAWCVPGGGDDMGERCTAAGDSGAVRTASHTWSGCLSVDVIAKWLCLWHAFLAHSAAFLCNALSADAL